MPGYLTPRLPDTEPGSDGPPSLPVRFVAGLESAPALDAVAAVLERLSAPLGHEPVRSILLGKGTGHALHPFLTDDQYRAKWGLPADYPLVAQSFSDLRSSAARAQRFGGIALAAE